MKRRYCVVDVFSDRALFGNPVAVILDAHALDSAAMQRIARWTNLSETTFVLPPSVATATHRVRIFTPASELPFAGHPTLGTAHAVVSAGIVSGARLVQECGAGLVPIEWASSGLRLRLPPARSTPIDPASCAELAAALRLPIDASVPPRLIDVGPKWLVARSSSRAALLAAQPDFGRLAALERRLGVTGASVFAAHDEAAPHDIETRSFAPSQGVDEDPVCGSGNGAIAEFRREHGLLAPGTRYVAAQGRCVGRDGRIDVELQANGDIWIGGRCVSTVVGEIDC
ncbi:MAG: PhzF family phenazine biosynthesis protein [Pseudohongiellaceae bacterium]